ncbi:MAG TPA: hypothetical protein VGB85_16545, partial [Nannocystis sp.]
MSVLFTTLALALLAAPPSPEATHRQLVFAGSLALGLGVLYPIPSGELGLFLGSELRPRRPRAGVPRRAALGYHGTVSAGYADLHYAASPRDRSLTGILFHRHGLMALGLGGRRGRLFHGIGGAVVFGDTAIIGVEVEGKLGWVFARSRA